MGAGDRLAAEGPALGCGRERWNCDQPKGEVDAASNQCGVCMLLDEARIVQPAVTTQDGLLFRTIVGRPDALDVNDNGRPIILEATFPGSISGASRLISHKCRLHVARLW